MSYVPLCTADTETELAVICSQLGETEIRYMIQGDNFCSPYAGQFGSLDRYYVLVWEDDLNQAENILNLGAQAE